MGKGLLENRIAIVSGGARGIGKAIAFSLAQQGCNIVIIDPGFSIEGEETNENNLVQETAEIISKKYNVKVLGYSIGVIQRSLPKKEHTQIINTNLVIDTCCKLWDKSHTWKLNQQGESTTYDRYKQVQKRIIKTRGL